MGTLSRWSLPRISDRTLLFPSWHTLPSIQSTPPCLTISCCAMLASRLPLLVGESSKLVHAGVGNTPKLVVSKAEEGSKENELCSNRGRCDQSSGVCSCYTGYTTSGGDGKPGDRGDCGAPELTIISCPVSKLRSRLCCAKHVLTRICCGSSLGRNRVQWAWVLLWRTAVSLLLCKWVGIGGLLDPHLPKRHRVVRLAHLG